jgi:O-antigen ligase
MLHIWALVYIAALYVRPGEIIPSIAEVPIIKYLSVGAGAAAALSLLLNPRKFWDRPHDKAMLGYWTVISISNPAWGYFAGGPAAFSDFSPVVFCYFLVRLGAHTVAQIARVTRLLVWLNVFLAVNGLLQVYTGSGFGNLEAMDTHEGIRIMGTGIFNDPNDLGMTLVMSLPFVLGAAFGKGSRFFGRVLSFACFCVLVLACYYTNSRGTILGLGAVIAAFSYRRFGGVTASVFALIGIVGLVALGPSRMSNVSSEEDSAQGRIQAWAAGIQMFKGSPLTGVGYRRFGDINGLVAHNAFVHVLGELGFLGAMAFVALFYWHFYWLRPARAPVVDPPRATLRQMLSDAALGLLVCICFLSRQYVVVPFILVALGANYAAALPGGENREEPSPLWHLTMIGAVTVGLIVTFYIVARLFARY